MNEWLVVDASVIIKAFVSEESSGSASSIWSSDAILAVPSHALAEVGEALRRKRAKNEITELQLAEVCLVLPRSFLSIAIDDLFARAMEVARQIPLGFYDGLYLAAAERLDCQVVTADAKFVSATTESIWEARTSPLDAFGATLTR